MAAAASRSPSPIASEEDTPAVFLTPRSKIKQLLAAVDESSDEDTTPGKKTTAKRQPPTTSAPSASSSEASDDDIIRPRGKFASRMLAQSKKPRAETAGPEEDARQRVRRILDQSDADESTHGAAATDVQMPDADQDQEADGDEDVVITKPRKLLQRRKQRSVTPEVNAPITSQSPGLFVSPATAREDSPGLFVTPSKPQSPSNGIAAADDSEDDAELPVNPLKSNRFLKILERKRKEREAREAEEAQKHAARLERATSVDFMSDGDEDEGNITDDEGGHKLTQEAARPTRKASKKALEDMNRETQRMSRSLQLAHEAKTKKKVTKASLFERFNFRPAGTAALPVLEPSNSSRPSSPVSGHHTDAEAKDSDTPPSSPPSAEKAAAESTNLLQAQPQEAALAPDSLVAAPGDAENSSLDAVLEEAAAKRRAEKGKEIAITAPPEEAAPAKLDPKRQTKSRPGLSVKFKAVMANLVTLDSDDEDLEILPAPKQSRVQDLFTNLPKNSAKESRPLQALRSLAQLDDPDKKPSATRIKGKHAKPSLSVGEMQFSLQQKAREQARQERDRRMEVLRAKGIHIQSAEEREQEMAQVEDMVARARKEAEEIQEREREAAKKDRQAKKDAGELDPLAWDDSEEDDSYEEEEPEELELSGSEEEGEGEDDEDEEEADKEVGLFDEAAESTDDGGSVDASDHESEEETDAPRKPGRGSRKRAVVLSDDEDEERVVEATPRPASKFFKSPSAHNNNSPQVPTSVLRSATKTFIPGLPIAGAAAGGLGLTQIFAGTMDDSQTGSIPGDDTSSADPMPSFGLFPDSNFSQTARDNSESMILDSQREVQAETQGAKVDLSFSQSQFQGFDSLLQRESTQLSEMIEPSQDKGFMGRTPLVNRFVAISSTMETVLADGRAEQEEEVAESPLVKRMGKLRRRNQNAGEPGPEPLEDHGIEPMETELEEEEFGFTTAQKPNTAFNVMRDAAAAEKKRKAQAEFDKAKSKAREMVEEQAEESEDEYAGLGGADGEGSDDDDDASVKEMVDDETKNTEADERKLAAFYA